MNIGSRRERSLEAGANLLRSSKSDSIDAIDIHIDEHGVWHENGIAKKPIEIMSNLAYYIDTTHIMPRRKGVYGEIFRHTFPHRSDVGRVLSMRNIKVPRYIALRHDINNANDEKNYINQMRNIWHTFHMPIVLSSDNKMLPSILTSNYRDALEHVKYMFDRGSDVLISQYVEGDTYTLTTMPDYRGEKLYIPIVHKILKKKYTIYNDYTKDKAYNSNMVRHDLSNDRLHEVLTLAKSAHRELGVSHPIQWDIIIGRDKSIYVSKAALYPDFHPNSKFVKCLDSTGINYLDMCKHYADKML